MSNLLLSKNFVDKFSAYDDGILNCEVNFILTYIHNFSTLGPDIYIKLLNDFTEAFDWTELVFDYEYGFVEHSHYTSIESFYQELKDFKKLVEYYDGFPYFYFHFAIKYSDTLNNEFSLLKCHNNILISCDPTSNMFKAEIEIEIKSEFFYDYMVDVDKKDFPSEFAVYNKKQLSDSFNKMKSKGYSISYLPIGLTKAYTRGARWDETGFLDYGKYSKYSDNNLRELYQMMVKNGEDVSEIELELQVRNIYLR